MRWIEEAVQKGRDYSNTDDSLLSVATIRKGIEKAKEKQAQQQRETDLRRGKDGVYKISIIILLSVCICVFNFNLATF